MGSRGIALVTGAGRGIGQALATRLAAAGYDVGVTARSTRQLAQTVSMVTARGRRCVMVAGDIAEPGFVSGLVKTVTAGLGPIDVLVNNAGYVGEPGRFLDFDDDDLLRVLHTNVRGPALLARAVVPGMVERGHGYVVNLASMLGSRPGYTTSGAYAISKAALMRLTDVLAVELAGTGVTVMDLSPGLVRTGMTASMPGLAGLPDSAWTSAELPAEVLVRLVSGEYDELHGRFVHSYDDLDALVQLVRGNADGRKLRLVPAGPDDPLDRPPIRKT